MARTATPHAEIYPLHQKLTLTVTETACYSGIGIQKIIELLERPDCDFRLDNGKRRMVKRKEFEAYISRNNVI